MGAKITTLNGTKSKETVYVDVDDEITAIIEKVANAKGSIIALVLPKRASVLQSVVNMKLLKRSADTAKKNLVLVTSEAALLPLAGLVGMHVADTATSKPVIPAAPEPFSDEPESLDEPLDAADGDEDFDAAAAAATPIGALAGNRSDDVPETLHVDNDEPDETPANVTPLKRNKKLAVPSFDKFKLRIALGVLAALLLIGGWVLAAVVLPKAVVELTTDSTTITSNLNITLDTAAKAVDAKTKIVPAMSQATQKTLTQQAPATGQQNDGDRATGSVKFSATQCAPNISQKPDPIPAGSSISASGHTYITQETAAYSFDSFTSGSCALYTTSATAIRALKAGADYNVGASTKFSGAGSGIGTASGGTDVITKVVAQSDIDAAKAKISSQDATTVKQDLSAALKGKGLKAIDSTFLAGEQQVTTNVNVGDKAESVTVTSVVPYSMLGVKEGDLKLLIEANVMTQIDSKRQKILDNGVSKAKFSQEAPGTANSAAVLVRAKSVAGPSLDVAAIKKQVAGKKAGQIQNDLKALPGITNAEVKYSPFWVSSVPKNIEKITVVIDGQVKGS